MKKLLHILLVFTFLLTNCTSITYVDKKRIVDIYPKDAGSWSLDDCNKILEFYSASNSTNKIFTSGPINQKVYIKAILLNKTSIKAMARKEVIEKRLDDKEFYSILDLYLKEFTSLSYDKSRGEIIEVDPNYSKGYTFKIYFENISDP